MSAFEMEDVAGRGDLVERIALMEAMIAEGRRSTSRYGWMFVLWGVLYFAAMGWALFLPAGYLAWPVCMGIGVLVGVRYRFQQRRGGTGEGVKSRSVHSVWVGLGIGVTAFVVAGVLSHHAGDPVYLVGIMFLIGMAHAVSALILKWTAQGLAAAAWWVCGAAAFFFTSSMQLVSLFLGAVFCGQILFGLYAMMLDRRRTAAPVGQHA